MATIKIDKPKTAKQSPLFWLKQLQKANINSSIENPSEWQRKVREDGVLIFP